MQLQGGPASWSETNAKVNCSYSPNKNVQQWPQDTGHRMLTLPQNQEACVCQVPTKLPSSTSSANPNDNVIPAPLRAFTMVTCPVGCATNSVWPGSLA